MAFFSLQNDLKNIKQLFKKAQKYKQSVILLINLSRFTGS